MQTQEPQLTITASCPPEASRPFGGGGDNHGSLVYLNSPLGLAKLVWGLVSSASRLLAGDSFDPFA